MTYIYGEFIVHLLMKCYYKLRRRRQEIYKTMYKTVYINACAANTIR